MDIKQISDNNWPRVLRITAVVFILFVLQHYFRRFGQPIEKIYFSVFFASIALTGLTLIAVSYLIGPMARLWPAKWEKYCNMRKQLGLIGLVFVVFHIFMALVVLTPVYFPKFFLETDRLSDLGQISVLTGILGFVIFIIVGITSLPSVEEKMTERGWFFVQRSGLVAIILSVFHFIVFKWRGWFNWNNWNNNIPPGTFVVTVFIALVFLIRAITYILERRKRKAEIKCIN